MLYEIFFQPGCDEYWCPGFVEKSISCLFFMEPITAVFQSLMEELTLVSFVPVNGGPFPVAGQQYSVGITTGTTVNFIASRYRIVFMLDLSPCCVAMVISHNMLFVLWYIMC